MRGDSSRLPVVLVAFVGGLATGLLLAACGGAGEESTPTTTAKAETPIATTESKYDEAWARKQVEPVLEESANLLLAQNWSKSYDLYSDEEKVGCSRSTFVSKMAYVWGIMTEAGIDDYLKAELQDLKDGKLVITFSEITPNRITYTVGETGGFPQRMNETIVRKDGKWRGKIQPLGQDCESLDILP